MPHDGVIDLTNHAVDERARRIDGAEEQILR
jgi:hypothetical protein